MNGHDFVGSCIAVCVLRAGILCGTTWLGLAPLGVSVCVTLACCNTVHYFHSVVCHCWLAAIPYTIFTVCAIVG